jgi:uncharacterized repeat protein (TIGR01451 family)
MPNLLGVDAWIRRGFSASDRKSARITRMRVALAILMAGLTFAYGIAPAFADQFYFTRMRAVSTSGTNPEDGTTGLFLWNDATNAQSQIGGDGTFLRHATDGRLAVDGIATNLSGTLYGFALDDTSTAGFIPWNPQPAAQCTSTQRSRLVSINTGTAVVTYVGGSWLTGRQITGAGFDGQGRLWAYDCVSASILQISTATGAIVSTPLSVGAAGAFEFAHDLDFAANGIGIMGHDELEFVVFDPNAGWVADVSINAQNNGFDGTLQPPYVVAGVAFTNHLSARNGSPLAQTCRLNLSEVRGTDELGHVNDPFFANPVIAHKDVNQYNPPNVANSNAGPGDMARVGGPALPSCFYDWGDAPASYATLRANTGARHLIAAGGPYLGTGLPDFEVDGQPNTAASGDDAAGTDDENGVVIPTLSFANPAQIQVQVGGNSAGTRLQAWIDWGRDGSFAQAGDRILTDAAVVTGTNTFTVTVPATAATGTTYARFRIANQTGLGVAGLAASGEVEDYQVQVAPQPAFTCDASMYLTQDSPTALYRFDTSSNPFVVTAVGPVSATTYNTTAFNPGDNYLYAIAGADSHLLRIGNDGSVADLGAVTGLPHVAGQEYNAGEFSPDGSYYVRLNTANNQLYRINPATRTASLIALDTAISVADLAWHNGLLYAVDNATTTINLVSINPSSGAVNVVGPIGVSGASFGAMFGASNGVYGGNNFGGFYRFDLTTGAATLISDLQGSGRNDGAKCSTTPLTFPADLAITKDDGSTTYTPGTNVTYSIVVSNSGPFGVQNALVTDALPAGITSANWTCATTSGGGTCGAASGSGAINSTANLPANGSVTYSLTLFVPSTFSGNLVNTATVTAPAGTTDSDPTNNTASDTDTQFPPPPANVANLSCGSDASLLNTAYDGAGGRLTSGSDTYWQVALTTTPITGAPPAGLTYNTAPVLTSPPANYIVSPYGNANWISHAADAAHAGAADVFYRYQFNLGPGTNPATFNPRLDFYSDNAVYQIWVNGESQNIQSNFGAADPYFYAGFQAGNAASGTLPGPWNSGFNEVVVHIKSGAPAQAFLAQVVLPQSICQPAMVSLNKTTRLIAGGPFGFGLSNTVQASGTVTTTTVDVPAQVDGDSSSAGTTEPFAVSAFGTDVVITENSLPSGWLLSDAVCTSGGTPVGSRSGSSYTIPGSIIDADAESFVCTFTNTPTTNLRIDKSVNPTTARTGETATYAIVVDNDGPGPGDGARLRDPAVEGVECSAATLACSASGGAVCPASLDVVALQGSGLTIPTFPAGGSLQFSMTCVVTASGQ